MPQKPAALPAPIFFTPSTLSEKSTLKLVKKRVRLSREEVEKFILEKRCFTYRKLKYTNRNYPEK